MADTKLNVLLTAIFLGAVAISPHSYAQSATASVSLEKPGRLISVGAHRLHIHCNGQGEPVIVLEAGLGGTSLEWRNIQNHLARSHRVCSYDRAGVGWSQTGPEPRTSDRITEELHTLLTNAGEPGPYILAGHSFGGYTVQLFASRYPQLAAALVLIDSSHPEQIQRFAAPPVQVNIVPKGRLLTLAPVGVPDNIPAEVRETAGALIMTHQSRLAVTRELEGFRYSARQLLKAAPLPEIPLIVLTRGIQKWPKNERGNRMETLWQQLQKELATKTVNAGQIIALNSGHHIHLDQPQLVIEAILLVAAMHNVRDTRTRRITLQPALYDIGRRYSGRARVVVDLPELSTMTMSRPY